MKEVNAPNCGRENDLIAFLYGELNEVEAQTFQRHVGDCALCNAELAAFRNVRESVVAWRNESLGGLVSSPITDSALTTGVYNKPSALAALREFFSLSPLWLKGAVAFASVLFCLFAGLAIARLRDKPPAAVVTNQTNSSDSAAQFNARVEQRVKEELARIKSATEKAPPSSAIVKNAPDRTSGRRLADRVSVAFNVPSRKARRPLSKSEREQLAADLRLVSARSENEIDLLDEGINR